MAGEMHQFPRRSEAPREAPPKPSLPAREPIVFETFEADDARGLLEIARRASTSAETLLSFIHENRDLAQHSGIETVGIEILVVMQGDRWQGVVEALEESEKTGRSAHISRDGLGLLKRVETLLAEASTNIRKFTDGDFSAMEIVESRARREADYHKAFLALEERRMDGIRKEIAAKEDAARRQAETIATLKSALGASRSSARSIGSSGIGESSDFPLWIPLVIFGAVTVVVVAVAVAAGGTKRK